MTWTRRSRHGNTAVFAAPLALLMDPEKNQLSTKSVTKSAFFRRDRLGKVLLILLFAVGAVQVLLALQGLVQHNTLTPKHGRLRLTTKEREKLFLYVHRPRQTAFMD